MPSRNERPDRSDAGARAAADGGQGLAAVTDFAAVRAELGLPPLADSAAFPAEVLAEAERAAADGAAAGREDATALPLVTIDPPGAMDLDQALLVLRRPGGFTLHYAIADVAAFVRPDGPIDAEARRRGQTLYLPDASVPLHPPALSAGAASLLPGQPRPAALWTIELGPDGEPTSARVRRAVVRSVARLDYAGVQADLDACVAHPSVEALPELGRLRRERAVERGAVELELPEQEIERDGSAAPGWRIVLRRRTDVDAWNAEMSLLTGISAASLMLDARIGVLRTLPQPDAKAIADLRREAIALGVDWPDGATPARVLSGLDPSDPIALAVHTEATRLLRGAGYVAFDGAPPEHTFHTGIGAAYAHVTAPLRRLVDRFAAEVCLAVSAEQPVPDWTRAALPALPDLMAASDRRASQVERACLDQVESWLLADRVGESFDAVVLRGASGNGSAPGHGGSEGSRGAEVFITDPPTMARCEGDNLPEGERVRVRLVDADPVTRVVRFTSDQA